MSEHGPTVTVVMPSFNHGSFIREAIDSILGQDYPTSVLVMDGGSTDGTLEVLASYGKCIEWVSEPDAGLYDAVNKGWARANSDWLGWVNCDDRLCLGAVRRLLEAASSHRPLPDLVYGDELRMNVDGDVLERIACGPPDAERLLRNGNSIFIGASLVRREFVHHIGSFDLRYPLAADYDFLVRCVTRGEAVHVPVPAAMFRMHTDSKSQSCRWQMWHETLEISRELYGRRSLRLGTRYLADRAAHSLFTDDVLWKRRLIPLRRSLRRIWEPRP